MADEIATEKFADYAPTISKAGVTKTFTEKVKPVQKVSELVIPNLTKTKVEKIINELSDVTVNGGIITIARSNKVLPDQVAIINREWKIALSKIKEEE